MATNLFYRTGNCLDVTGTLALKTTFDFVTDIGKDVFRIATVASSFEDFNVQREGQGPSISGISGLNQRQRRPG